MNTTQLIQQHTQELHLIKSQIYDAEQRMIELKGIIATLQYVQSESATNESE